MKSLEKTLVWTFIALWVLVSNHCALERVPGLDFLACSSPETEASHQPSGCGDEDACAAVESGLYKSEERQTLSPKPSFAAVRFAVLLLEITAPPSASRQDSPEPIPPELAHTWQFSFRTALSPRAPSLHS